MSDNYYCKLEIEKNVVNGTKVKNIILKVKVKFTFSPLPLFK